jgi:integrase
MRILSHTEQQRLNRYLYENLSLCNLGILLCLYTGLRVGEICALKWKDIVFEEHYLHVHQTMQRIQKKNNGEKKTEILIAPPKSDCSVRNVPIPDEVFRLVAEAKCTADAYFLTGTVHSYMEPRTMQNRFKAAVKACGIGDANFHALRHTFATRCVELGFDVKSLSEILGHASVNITLNRYVHPSMELKQRNMNMFCNLFSVK